MKCTVKTGQGGMINIQGSIKTGTDVEGVLRFCLRNLKAVMLVLLVEGIY
jgi:hypothetical protein